MEDTYVPVPGWSVFKKGDMNREVEIRSLVLGSDGRSSYINKDGELVGIDRIMGHYVGKSR